MIWADVSQYQGIPVDDDYPHPVLCFRTNSGGRIDNLAPANARRAKDLLNRGKLQAVIAYYFFRPGQANCDLHKELLIEAGLWGSPRLVSMIDVEDAGGIIRGDQSAEVNDEAERLAAWYGDPRRVIGYWNPVSNFDLWPTRPAWMRLVVPSYGRSPGQPARKPVGYFAHQYTDAGRCAPWPNGVDLNHCDLELPDLLASFGIEGGPAMGDVVAEGAGQLHPFPNKIRQIVNEEHVQPSTRNPEQPWPYDMWTDIWNNVVWDGFTLEGEATVEKKTLVGWVLDTNARVRACESKLDQVLELLRGEQ